MILAGQATIPAGLKSNGEPYGIYIIGRRGSEAALLGIM